jgi:hypothetical protein
MCMGSNRGDEVFGYPALEQIDTSAMAEVEMKVLTKMDEMKAMMVRMMALMEKMEDEMREMKHEMEEMKDKKVYHEHTHTHPEAENNQHRHQD